MQGRTRARWGSWALCWRCPRQRTTQPVVPRRSASATNQRSGKRRPAVARPTARAPAHTAAPTTHQSAAARPTARASRHVHLGPHSRPSSCTASPASPAWRLQRNPWQAGQAQAQQWGGTRESIRATTGTSTHMAASTHMANSTHMATAGTVGTRGGTAAMHGMLQLTLRPRQKKWRRPWGRAGRQRVSRGRWPSAPASSTKCGLLWQCCGVDLQGAEATLSGCRSCISNLLVARRAAKQCEMVLLLGACDRCVLYPVF